LYGSERKSSWRDKENVKIISETLKVLLGGGGPKTKKVGLIVSGPGVHIKRISISTLSKAELKAAASNPLRISPSNR